jgi:hypothetical protein
MGRKTVKDTGRNAYERDDAKANVEEGSTKDHAID